MPIDLPELINQLFTGCVTALFTIIGGVIVLVGGQLAVKFFIDPLHEQAKLLGEIAHSMTFYANVFGHGDIVEKEVVDEASETLRRQASQLRASAWTIRWYGLWESLRLVPRRENAIKASQSLIGLSNSMKTVNFEGVHRRQGEIKELLGFH